MTCGCSSLCLASLREYGVIKTSMLAEGPSSDPNLPWSSMKQLRPGCTCVYLLLIQYPRPGVWPLLSLCKQVTSMLHKIRCLSQSHLHVLSNHTRLCGPSLKATSRSEIFFLPVDLVNVLSLSYYSCWHWGEHTSQGSLDSKLKQGYGCWQNCGIQHKNSAWN